MELANTPNAKMKAPTPCLLDEYTVAPFD